MYSTVLSKYSSVTVGSPTLPSDGSEMFFSYIKKSSGAVPQYSDSQIGYIKKR